jgi:hypothetical protein
MVRQHGEWPSVQVGDEPRMMNAQKGTGIGRSGAGALMARFRLVRRVFVSFCQLKGRRRALLAEAGFCLLMARLALIFVPFPLLARRLGTFVPPTDPRTAEVKTAVMTEHTRVALEIGWAVTRAAWYVPFRAVCLPQAMAARLMLSRRGVKSVMHFGAVKGTKKPIDAHAWLDAAGVEVTGYPMAADFVEIACFV